MTEDTDLFITILFWFALVVAFFMPFDIGKDLDEDT